ncbi:MAG: hypothetical protein J6N22_08490, partial [Schwartzia sp.]|nr:hypothetical protein [Schwartzia sp. (in: firmicutes)]
SNHVPRNIGHGLSCGVADVVDAFFHPFLLYIDVFFHCIELAKKYNMMHEKCPSENLCRISEGHFFHTVSC